MQTAAERRPTLFLIVVLASLFLLMSTNARTRRIEDQRTFLVRGVVRLFAPVLEAVDWAYSRVSDTWNGYVDMRTAVRENVELRRRIAGLTTENVGLRNRNVEISRLRAILGYSEEVDLPATLARVVMIDTGGRFKSLILDRGSDEGIRVNDPVLSAEGLVGRVVLTTPSVSKVQLIIDGDSSVGVHFERTHRQGVVRGTGSDELAMAFVPFTADVVAGDRVFTAGIDGTYPRGILVGKVTSVEKGKDLFKTVRCAPATDFSSLEDLIVLSPRPIDPAATEFRP
ncbi:MAG: rod shape-determining protein MreC [Thermoanaerobaculia bacterium]|jgi:rod shape-determining protein MreC